MNLINNPEMATTKSWAHSLSTILRPENRDKERSDARRSNFDQELMRLPLGHV